VVFLFKYKLSICFYYDLFLKVPYYRAILKLLVPQISSGNTKYVYTGVMHTYN